MLLLVYNRTPFCFVDIVKMKRDYLSGRAALVTSNQEPKPERTKYLYGMQQLPSLIYLLIIYQVNSKRVGGRSNKIQSIARKFGRDNWGDKNPSF